MSTLLRFYNNGSLVQIVQIHNIDAHVDTLNWLITHDIGNMCYISLMYRFYAKEKYLQAFQLHTNYSNIKYATHCIDIGKWGTNDRLRVKIYNPIIKKCVVDVPEEFETLFSN